MTLGIGADDGAAADGTLLESCGLVIHSDIPFAARRPRATSAALRITHEPTSDEQPSNSGEVIAELRRGDTVVQTITLEPNGWRMDFAGMATAFLSRDLATCRVRAHNPDGQQLLEVLVAGPVLAFALTMRGAAVLHGSAVTSGARAVAFVGPSGGGKSTLAGMLALRGAELVTDDILRLDRDGDTISVAAGSPELRLRDTAAALAALMTAPKHTTADGRTAVLLGSDDPSPVPLAAVVVSVLDRRASRASVRRLGGAEATAALLRCPRLPHLATSDVLAQLLATCTDVADAVPVLEATLPWQQDLRPEVPEHLEKLLRDEVGWP